MDGIQVFRNQGMVRNQIKTTWIGALRVCTSLFYRLTCMILVVIAIYRVFEILYWEYRCYEYRQVSVNIFGVSHNVEYLKPIYVRTIVEAFRALSMDNMSGNE